jgi:hypothetical protein
MEAALIESVFSPRQSSRAASRRNLGSENQNEPSFSPNLVSRQGQESSDSAEPFQLPRLVVGYVDPP